MVDTASLPPGALGCTGLPGTKLRQILAGHRFFRNGNDPQKVVFSICGWVLSPKKSWLVERPPVTLAALECQFNWISPEKCENCTLIPHGRIKWHRSPNRTRRRGRSHKTKTNKTWWNVRWYDSYDTQNDSNTILHRANLCHVQTFGVLMKHLRKQFNSGWTI